jgi:hypothetical protein
MGVAQVINARTIDEPQRAIRAAIATLLQRHPRGKTLAASPRPTPAVRRTSSCCGDSCGPWRWPPRSSLWGWNGC